jgi:hypothetical protein
VSGYRRRRDRPERARLASAGGRPGEPEVRPICERKAQRRARARSAPAQAKRASDRPRARLTSSATPAG